MNYQDFYRRGRDLIYQKMESTVLEPLEQFTDVEDFSFKRLKHQLLEAIVKRTHQDIENIMDHLKAGKKDSLDELERHFLEVQQEQTEDLERYLDGLQLTFSSHFYERQYQPSGKENDPVQDIDQKGSRKSIVKSCSSSKRSIVRKNSCKFVRKSSRQYSGQHQSAGRRSSGVQAVVQAEVQPQAGTKEEQAGRIQIEPKQDSAAQLNQSAEQNSQHESQVQLQKQQELQIQAPKQPTTEVVLNIPQVKPQEQVLSQTIQEQIKEENIEHGDTLSASERSERLNSLYRRSQKMRQKFVKLSPMVISPQHYASSQSEAPITEWKQQKLQASFSSQAGFLKTKEQPQKTATSSVNQSVDYPLAYSADGPILYSSQVIQPKQT